MAEKIKLQIAEPCHENWDSMTSSEKGRFCGSCQKQVVDFTSMTDSQLVAFFKKSSTGSVCGRFIHTQLDREVKAPPKQVPWARYVFQFTFPAFVATLKANAQDVKMGKIAVSSVQVQQHGNCQPLQPATTEPGDTTPRRIPPVVMGMVALPSPVNELIRGRVVDQDNKPIPNASILTGQRTGVTADANGYFQYAVVRGWKEITLTVSAIGYERQQLTVRPTDDFANLRVMMLPEEIHVVGEVVVVKAESRPAAPITGSVVNDRGEPIPFAFLEVPGVSTTTNKDGQFFLSPAKRWKQVLVAVSAEGYRPKLVPLKSNEKLDNLIIHLDPTPTKQLQEENARRTQAWSWKIFPNPVQPGNRVAININGNETGDYRIWVTDVAGNRISDKNVSLAKGQNSIYIETGENWKPGVYVLQLLNSGGFTCLSEKFVVK